MAERRMISRRVAMSKKLSHISWQAEAIWFRCLPFTDDAGRIEADLDELRATVIPRGKHGKQLPLQVIEKALQELHNVGLIQLYTINGDNYLQFERWGDFQTLKADRKPKIDCPAPDGTHWNPLESCGTQEGKLREGKGSKGKAVSTAKFTPEFEDFWKEYPRKKDKGKAFRCWNILLDQEVSPATLITCAKHYSSECTRNETETRYIKLPATFLGPDKPHEDYIESEHTPRDPEETREYLRLFEEGKRDGSLILDKEKRMVIVTATGERWDGQRGYQRQADATERSPGKSTAY